MTTIGFIGAGAIGSTVARLAVSAGYDVVISNRRGPDTLAGLIDELGSKARAATIEEAAAAGDIVVVAIPMLAYRSVPAERLRGTVLIDANNYFAQRDDNIPELDDESTTSSELLQAHAPEARVVKLFNNIDATHIKNLARPAGSVDRSVLAIAGDDQGAKDAVTAFLDAIGYEALDAGPLAEGWRYQGYTPAFAVPYFSNPNARPTASGFFDERDTGEGSPVSAETLRQKLAEARRYRDM